MKEFTFNPANLKTLIKRDGFSHKYVSEGTGISIATLRSYTCGKRVPSLKNLITLADYFAVPVDYLLGRCSEEESEAIKKDYCKNILETRRKLFEGYLTREIYFPLLVDDSDLCWPNNLLVALTGDWGYFSWAVLTTDQEKKIDDVVNALNEGERNVVLLNFKKHRNYSEIGKELNTTRECVRQLKANALRRLRKIALFEIYCKSF